MTDVSGTYVPRAEEEAAIREQLDKVRLDRTSRALLLLGPGGAGKTTLVRHVAERLRPSGRVTWVRPIDVDDSWYWLLSNLESAVAESLDPDQGYFAAYDQELARIGQVSNDRVSYETVLSQLGRINRTFVDCYRTFVEKTGTTVVITLDTIEAVRSMFLLLTLTQWMKELPRTLFILSGRPPAGERVDEHGAPVGEVPVDPLRAELDDPHRPLESVEIRLGGFADDEARQFLEQSDLYDSLSEDERARVIALTARQPLWLALAVEYLRHSNLPSEMTTDDEPTAEVQAEFRRRLVTRYRSTSFWPEAIKRLAVIRHSVTKEAWIKLMSDRELPQDAADPDTAWAQLLERPWVRPRANARYVTLHDALAEELSQRIIPLHDQDGSWRSVLWIRTEQIYERLTSAEAERVDAERASIGAALGSDGGTLVERIAAADADKRELDQLLTARLHYAILADFAGGTDLFLELFQRATDRPDPLFLELICHEMESFLPGRVETNKLPDEVLDLAASRFRRWLQHEEPERYAGIAVRIAGFLIRNEQPAPALELLQNLPDGSAFDATLRYRIANEQGNACIRIPGHVANAKQHFEDALEQARSFPGEVDRVRGEAEAHKELGFYYRNLGRWREADEAYKTARDVLSQVMGPGSDEAFRQEMASIQTNWAYLKALRGFHRQARNLVDSAIAVRRKYADKHEVGVSLSVSGEVFRYEGKFGRAMVVYREAEEIFQESKSWPWLGVLYQQMAICLHQAAREGIELAPHLRGDPVSLVQQSLDICRESNVRSYPSALNRAGRIFFTAGRQDEGLDQLALGIDEAQRIGDGWFLSANLIEYAEYAYRAWISTGESRYRTLIDGRAGQVEEVARAYGFRDMVARWDLLQGHIITIDALSSGDHTRLDDAATHYADGFRALADESVGSHGASAVAREFLRFRALFDRLPEPSQRRWYRRLSEDWQSATTTAEQETTLLARLEELY